jgi:integrase/recombinase XerD
LQTLVYSPKAVNLAAWRGKQVYRRKSIEIDLLFAFREHLRVLGRSEATVEAYGEQLKCFLDICGDVKKVTRKAIEDYIASLAGYRTREGKPYRPGTIALKVRSIKRFFEFLEHTNVIFINPAELISEPNSVKGLPKNVLTIDEALKVLEQPNLSTLTGIRDRAVLEVFYSTGIRLEELCSLTIFDPDLQGAMLRVNKGKGKKDRVVPLGKHAVKFLREYVTKVRPHFTRKNKKDRRLFMDTYGKPLSKAMVSITIRTCARAAGIGKKVSAHTFRHTFATELIRGGADIMAVQKMLGHSDIKTTEVYLRAAGVDVKAAHKKTHPREKEKDAGYSLKPRLERIRPKYEHKS